MQIRFLQFIEEWYIRSRDVTQPSALETIVVLVLLTASVYAFWRRFGPVVRTIRGSKPDPDFRLRLSLIHI